jgi:hypothetical protein
MNNDKSSFGVTGKRRIVAATGAALDIDEEADTFEAE